MKRYEAKRERSWHEGKEQRCGNGEFIDFCLLEISRSHLNSLASYYSYSLGSACGAFVDLIANMLDMEINALCFMKNIYHMLK